MFAILYDPDDYHMIAEVGDFLEHLLHCPGCTRHAQTPDGRAGLERIIARLDAISGAGLTADNILAALQFCTAWLDAHNILSLVDCVAEGQFSEPTDERCRATKH